MTFEILLGHKFNENHRTAVLLTRYLGVSRGIETCLLEEWYGVLEAIIEQETIIDVLRLPDNGTAGLSAARSLLK